MKNPINIYKSFLALRENSCYSPGHYYSPIVSVKELRLREQEVWKVSPEISGINLRLEQQRALLSEFTTYYDECKFPQAQDPNRRYYFDNRFYSYTDGIILYCFLRHIRPARVIEVGSGYSSAVMLDTKDDFDLNCEFTFIEPYPDRLKSLLKESDYRHTTIIEDNVQNVPLEEFSKLEAGDFLFIDSTHVSKTGSDVNYLFFDILPNLRPGVFIHIHDVFAGFEYPKEWVYQGRNWNEDYLLRAFLTNNNKFHIRLFSNHIHTYFPEFFDQLPLTRNNFGGNIWLEKVG
ncbi:MAG: class I SAM-dependent methyltransferase [Cytophagia bacterium]|nr:class I SAM-dependent methyltransferase [Cytophagia bacterium]